jgi:GAF domain-containing protein
VGLLARDLRNGDLVRRVSEIPANRFEELLEQITEETKELLEMVEVAQGETFDSALAQVLEAFALKLAEGVGAEQTRVYFVAPGRREIFSLAPSSTGAPLETRATIERGIAGRVARTGRAENVADLTEEAAFDPEVDLCDAERAGHVLALPLLDATGEAFAVIELVRSDPMPAFQKSDQSQVESLTSSLSLILQTWFRMSCSCRSGAGSAEPSCCAAPDSATAAP